MIIDTKEAARRLGVSQTRVIQLLLAGRIPNATKLGGQRGVWAIEVEGDVPPEIIGGDRRRKVSPP
jgi:hypothetical protein